MFSDLNTLLLHISSIFTHNDTENDKTFDVSDDLDKLIGKTGLSYEESIEFFNYCFSVIKCNDFFTDSCIEKLFKSICVLLYNKYQEIEIIIEFLNQFVGIFPSYLQYILSFLYIIGLNSKNDKIIHKIDEILMNIPSVPKQFIHYIYVTSELLAETSLIDHINLILCNSSLITAHIDTGKEFGGFFNPGIQLLQSITKKKSLNLTELDEYSSMPFFPFCEEIFKYLLSNALKTHQFESKFFIRLIKSFPTFDAKMFLVFLIITKEWMKESSGFDFSIFGCTALFSSFSQHVYSYSSSEYYELFREFTIITSKMPTPFNLHWEHLIVNISSDNMNQELFEALSAFLSNEIEPLYGIFTRINTSLLSLIIHSSFAKQFFGMVYCAIENFPFNCIRLVNSGFISCLFGMINTIDQANIFEILRIITKVYTWDCTRPLVFSLFRLMSPYSKTQRSKNSLQIIDTITNIFATSVMSLRSLIAFSSRTVSYLELPKLRSNDISNGFVVTIRFLPTILDKSSSIPLLKVDNGNNSLMISFSQNVLSVFINKESTEFSFSCPMNQWVDFKMIAKKGNEINMDFQGQKYGFRINDYSVFSKGMISFFSNIVPTDSNNYCVLFSEIEICNTDVEKYYMGDSGFFSGNEKLILSFRSDSLFDDKSLKNVVLTKTGNAKFSGSSFAHITSFPSVFEASNGIEFILSLFDQIKLNSFENIPDGRIFLVSLTNCLKSIVKYSNSFQDKLQKNNGFQIIAHCLEKYTHAMSPEFWSSVFGFESMLISADLLLDYHLNISKNVFLWINTSPLCFEILLGYLLGIGRRCIEGKQIISVFFVIDLIFFMFKNNYLTESLIDQFVLLIKCHIIDGIDINGFNYLDNLICEMRINEYFYDSILQLFGEILNLNCTKLWELIPRSKLFTNIDHKIVKFLMIYQPASTSLYSEYVISFVLSLEKYSNEYLTEVIENIIESLNSFSSLQSIFILICFAMCFPEPCEQIKLHIDSVIKTSTHEPKRDSLNYFQYIILFLYYSRTRDSYCSLCDFFVSDYRSLSTFVACAELILLTTGFDSYCILNSVFIKILSKRTYSLNDSEYIIRTISRYIFYGVGRGIDNSISLYHKENFLSSYFRKINEYNINKELYSYGLHTNNGIWSDEEVFVNVVDFIYSIQADISFVSNIMPFILCFLYSHSINISAPLSLHRIHQYIESKKDMPAIVQFYQSINSKRSISGKSFDLIEKIQIFQEKFFFQISDYIPPVFFKVGVSDHSIDNSIIINDLMKSSESIAEKKQGVTNQWQKLLTKISIFVNPLGFGSEIGSPVHYKIGHHFDSKFRPFLLTINKHFDNHNESIHPEVKNGQSYHEPETINENSDISECFEKYNTKNDEVCLWRSKCERIKPKDSFEGIFYLYSHGFCFSSEGRKCCFVKNDEVTHIFWTWIQQYPNSLTIFSSRKECFLFCFKDFTHSYLMSKFLLISYPNSIFIQTKKPSSELSDLKLTTKWQNYEISTFEYIMWLNLLSGRSFNDTRIYPLFPLIIHDMEKPKYEIDDEIFYRDFSRNIIYLSPNQVNTIQERIQFDDDMDKVSQHSSFVSNPFVVCHYLIRLEPFTTIHIRLQDGRFDNPNRQFFSLIDMIKRLKNPAAAAREIIPEFFYLVELFYNTNGFQIGVSSKGRTDIVDMPEWSESPVDFVNKFRLSLESKHVSRNINEWFDLIWGTKVYGNEALSVINKFDNRIYPNTWDEENKKEPDYQLTTMCLLNTTGQIPQQLFFDSHPKRLDFSQVRMDLNPFTFQNIPNIVVAMFTIGISTEHVKLYSVLLDGSLFCIRLAAPCFEIPFPLVPKSKSLPNNVSKICFTNYPDLGIVYSPDDSSDTILFRFANRKIVSSSSSPHLSPITHVFSGAKYYLTISEDACAAVWLYKKKSIRLSNTILAHETSIVSGLINECFGLVLTASSDGKLIISQLPNLVLLRSINLEANGQIPSFIRVSDEYGLIYVFLNSSNKNTIKTYTINGTFVGEKTISASTVSICIISYQFRDYLCVLDKDNKIRLYDHLTLNELRVIYSKPPRVYCMEYSREFKHLIISTEAMKLIFIPTDKLFNK